MSNNTRRPPFDGNYSDGRGRRPVQQPTKPQKQSSQLHIHDGFMYVLALMFFFAGGFMLLCFKIGRAFFMFILGFTLLPVLSDILLKIVPNPRSMGMRIITNRFLRIVAALLIGFIICISFLVSLVNDGREARENDLLAPTPSPTIEATATLTPTAEPTATPTPTIVPESTEELMSVDDLVAKLDDAVERTKDSMDGIDVCTEFKDGFYCINFVPDDTVLYDLIALTTPEGLTDSEYDIMKESYDVLTTEFRSMSKSLKAMFDESGHSEYHVMVNLINPKNEQNILYSAIDGITGYSVVD